MLNTLNDIINNRYPGSVTEWMNDAACKNLSTSYFFPGRRMKDKEVDNRVAVALAACKKCPVITECLDYSNGWLPNTDVKEIGIWGGQRERQRVKGRKQRKANVGKRKFCRRGHESNEKNTSKRIGKNGSVILTCIPCTKISRDKRRVNSNEK